MCKICLEEDDGTSGADCMLASKFPKCHKCDKKHHVAFHVALELLRQKEVQSSYSAQSVSAEANPSYSFQSASVVNYRSSLSPDLIGQIRVMSNAQIKVGILLDVVLSLH